MRKQRKLDSDETRYSEVIKVSDYKLEIKNYKIKMSNQNAKSDLIWMKLGSWEILRSLITNLSLKLRNDENRF